MLGTIHISLQVGIKFQHISGMYSDLLAVDVSGRLHTWAWQSHLPHPLPLALERELGLEGEKIRLIASRVLRASVITESGKVLCNLNSVSCTHNLTPPLPSPPPGGHVAGPVCQFCILSSGAPSDCLP